VVQARAIARAERPEVLSRLAQAQVSIRSAKNDVGINVALAIVFPKANGTDLVPAAFAQGQIPAAGAGINPSEFPGNIRV
jgi:hypothetical protein